MVRGEGGRGWGWGGSGDSRGAGKGVEEWSAGLGEGVYYDALYIS